jgi:hypothetical protein
MESAAETKTDVLDKVRIRIDGSWKAQGFSEFFDALERLYIFFGAKLPTPYSRSVILPSERTFTSVLRSASDGNHDGALASLLAKMAESNLEGIDSLIDGLFLDGGHEAVMEWLEILNVGSFFERLVEHAWFRYGDQQAVLQDAQLSREKYLVLSTLGTTVFRRAQSHKALSGELLMGTPALSVLQIKFSSPGYTDLAGLGQIIGHLKELLLELLKLRGHSDWQRVQVKKLEAEVRLINAQAADVELVTLSKRLNELRNLGYSREELFFMSADVDIQVGRLFSLIREGRITSIDQEDAARKP